MDKWIVIWTSELFFYSRWISNPAKPELSRCVCRPSAACSREMCRWTSKQKAMRLCPCSLAMSWWPPSRMRRTGQTALSRFAFASVVLYWSGKQLKVVVLALGAFDKVLSYLTRIADTNNSRICSTFGQCVTVYNILLAKLKYVFDIYRYVYTYILYTYYRFYMSNSQNDRWLHKIVID